MGKFIVRVFYTDERCERVEFANGISATEYAKQCVKRLDVKTVELKDYTTGDKETYWEASNGDIFIAVGF